MRRMVRFISSLPDEARRYIFVFWFGGALYSLWGVICQWMIPGLTEPRWHRQVLTATCFSAGLIALRRSFWPRVPSLYLAIVCLLMLHHNYLLNINGFPPLLMECQFLGMIIVSAPILDLRQLSAFLLISTCLALVGRWEGTFDRRIELFLLSLSASIILLYINWERSRARGHLEARERLYHTTFDAAPIGIAHISPDGRILEVNKGFAHILKTTPEALQGNHFSELTHPDERERDLAAFQACISGELDRYRVEKRYRAATGEWIWVQLLANPVRDASGAFQFFVTMILDLTDRKRAETWLANNTERFRLMDEQSPVGTVLLDRNMRYLHANSRYLQMIGYTLHELREKSVVDLTHPDDREESIRIDQKLAHDMKGLHNFTKRMICRDGQVKWVRVRATVLPKHLSRSGETVLFSHVEDISELKASEALLEQERAKSVQTAKMSSLGEMAAGIAHEINNPLGVIVGKAQLIHKLACDGKLDLEVAKRNSLTISQTAQRIASIITGLRTFARDGSGEPMTPTTVYRLTEDTLVFCRSRFANHGVDLSVLIRNPMLSVNCRPVQIQQVILNLLNNAFDALEHLKEKWVQLDCYEEDGTVVVRVTDSGRGIPPELREKIMQPFFTTKPPGKGTGLGLSIAMGIIRSHGGTLELDPSNRNTSFMIRLPKAQRNEN